eukprot:11865287-Ditylum_brightwellii.AAC.1
MSLQAKNGLQLMEANKVSMQQASAELVVHEMSIAIQAEEEWLTLLEDIEREKSKDAARDARDASKQAKVEAKEAKMQKQFATELIQDRMEVEKKLASNKAEEDKNMVWYLQ